MLKYYVHMLMFPILGGIEVLIRWTLTYRVRLTVETHWSNQLPVNSIYC